LANTAPVAFGAMAAPIITLSSVTGIDIHLLSQMAGRQTSFVAVLVPFILVFLVDGWRGLHQTWAIAAVAGVTFGAKPGLSQFVTSNFIAVEITDTVAAVVTVAVVLAVLRIRRPALADMATEPEDRTPSAEPASAGTATTVARVDTATRRSAKSTLLAVAPHLVIIAATACQWL
jgi:lactate permease